MKDTIQNMNKKKKKQLSMLEKVFSLKHYTFLSMVCVLLHQFNLRLDIIKVSVVTLDSSLFAGRRES